MNNSAASTIPTDTAITMSKTTLSNRQVQGTATSLRSPSRVPRSTCRYSLMRQVTVSSRAANDAIGQVAEQRRQRQHHHQYEEGVDEAGERGTGPGADVGGGARDGAGGGDAAKEGSDEVAQNPVRPARLGVVFGAVSPSPTTAESSDSMAPSMAMAKAASTSACSSAKEMPSSARRSRRSTSGASAWSRPISTTARSTGRPTRPSSTSSTSS